MGAALPSLALSALQMGMGVASQDAAAQAQKEQAKAQASQLRLQQDADARARRERLQRALATQRARFGAQGIASSGSASAVLAGLASESERESSEARALYNHRVQGIEQQLAWSQRKNLLDASSPQNRMAFTMLQRGTRTVPLL